MSEETMNVDTKTEPAESSPPKTTTTPTINTESLINRTTTMQLNNSLNIITKKPQNVLTSNNSIFIIPQPSQQSNDSNQLTNTFHSPNSEPKPTLNTNKITLIPLNNLSSLKTTPTTLAPNSSPTNKNILTTGSKKVIINTAQPGAGLITPVAALNTADNNHPNNNNNNNNNKTINTITLTKTPPSANAKILTATNSLSQPISVQLATTNLNPNANKIQYVKIVNTGNNTQQLQMHQQTIPANMTKAIKITTITANSNNNHGSTNNSQNINTNENGNTRSISSILSINSSNTQTTSAITPVLKQAQQQAATAAQTPTTPTNEASSVLFDALKNNGQAPATPNGDLANTTTTQIKLQTYQLINPTSNSTSPQKSQNPKTPLIQKITSNVSSQQITKTIVSATTSPASNTQHSNSLTSNYKVLAQQLPQQPPPPQTQTQSFTLKQANPAHNKVGTVGKPSQVDESVARKPQVITTIGAKNAINPTPVQLTPISPVNLATNAKSTSLPNKPTTPNTSPALISNNQITVDSNELDSLSKSFGTSSPVSFQQPQSPKPSSQPTSSANTAASSTTSTNMRLPIQPHIASINTTTTAASVSPPLPTAGNQTNNQVSSSNNRKPCNCTKSMCLKLYCDCFAMGSFCHDCNCINCYNTLEHEDERNKAIKMVLDRNPQAFQSKIGKFTAQITLAKVVPAPIVVGKKGPEETLPVAAATTEEIDEIQSRHIKGCNCKKSNCLKRYCECYLAKIQCSTLCKCIGCKNCDESTKTLLQLANAADLRKQQQIQQQTQQQQQQQQHQAPHQINFSQQLSSKLFNSQQQMLPGGGNYSASSSSLWKQGALVDSSELNGKIGSEHKSRNSQINNDNVQNLNRTYSSVTNEAIEVTCSRLIEKVASELKNLKTEKIEVDKNNLAGDDEKMEDDEDEDNEDDDEDEEEDEYDELMERLVIEEFGKCLVELIQTAEKKN